MPENLDGLRELMLVYRGAGLGRFHCTGYGGAKSSIYLVLAPPAISK